MCGERTGTRLPFSQVKQIVTLQCTVSLKCFDLGFLVHNYRSYSVLETDPTAYLDFTQERNDTLKGEMSFLYPTLIKTACAQD